MKYPTIRIRRYILISLAYLLVYEPNKQQLRAVQPHIHISETDTIPTQATSEDKSEKSFDEIVYNWTLTFAEMLQLVGEKHYQTKCIEECMTNALEAFLVQLDPHSGFLDPKTYKQMLESTSGEFFGIGIVIDNTRNKKDKILLIVDTVPDGPSDKAGLKPWDKIIEIEGKSLIGMTTEEATALLKGPRNSTVSIKVLREGKQDPLSFTITRDIIKEQNLLSFYLPDQNIHYISLNMFSQTAVNQIESILKKAAAQKSNGIILDLRNNSGGLLNSVIDIAGLFLNKGSLVAVTKNKHGQETARYTTTREPIAQYDCPIIVLINNYTASAAEILSGVLKIASTQEARTCGNQQKKLWIFLVGTATFGKGSVQEVIPISNNSALKLTTCLYFLPGDTTIQGIGVSPDFEIERQISQSKHMKWVTKFYGREEKLKNYINLHPNHSDKIQKPKKDPDKKKQWADRARKILKEDNQFHIALILLNIFQNARLHTPNLVSNRTSALDYLKKQYTNMHNIQMEEIKI